MAGYKDRTQRLTFPELSEDGDEIFIVIRNPKTVPPDFMQSSADGKDDPSVAEMNAASREIVARFIIAGHVYDAADHSDDPALLAFPGDAETMAKLPREIWIKVNKAIVEIPEAKAPEDPS